MPSLGIDLCPPDIFIPPGQGPYEVSQLPAAIKLSPDQTVSGPTFVDAQDLEWLALGIGTYVYRMTAFWSTPRKRTGLRVAMDFTGSELLIRYYVRDVAGTAIANAEGFMRRGQKNPALNWLTIDGLLIAETAGDLRLQIASENDHPVTLHPGSFGMLAKARSA